MRVDRLAQIEVFITLARLVFDRDTGKPKGYGFCEFAGTAIYSDMRQYSICLT